MTKKPLNTCVVGFGKISSGYADDPVMAKYYRYTTHAQVLRDHPRFAFVAAVDPDAGALKIAREQWGVARTAGRVVDLDGRADIDVAVLATPPGPGRLEALMAFPNLKAVIAEKPLGRDAEEAHAFIKACAHRNIAVQVNLWRRADKTFCALADGELKKHIGRLQSGHALYGNGLRNNGVHMVDLIRMLLGEITAVQALGPARTELGLPIPGDIQVPAILWLESGRHILLSPLSFRAYREVGLDLWGDEGRLSILQEGLSINVYPRAPNRAMTGEHEIASDAPVAIPSTVGDAFWNVYDDLAAALDAGHAPRSTPASALQSETVIEMIALSATSGHKQSVPTHT